LLQAWPFPAASKRTGLDFMTFTTLTFLLFLPLVFALYWLTPSRRGQNVLLVVASFAFYGWWDWRFAGLMLAASLIDFAGALAIEASSSTAVRRAWLALSIGSNLTLLGFFKYFHFFVDNLRAAAGQLGWQFDDVTLQVVLPLGISFYTFQTMSYTIDVYRRQLAPSRSVVEYLAFVTFFPQLVAGPIERAVDLLPQMAQPRRFEYAPAVDGCRQMLWGFFKKMVLADGLAPLVQQVYRDPAGQSGPALALATVCFAFQIYCDFSAYSDIAIGAARLFGIRLSRNFAYPYFSQSMAEFWRRWHISLSSWFRDYVYIPLGGSRTTPLRRAANLLTTFTVSGLWHGAAWNFIAWGGLNGAAVLPSTLVRGHAATPRSSDVPGGEGWLPRPSAAVRMLLTFAGVCLGWVFFRAASWPQGVDIVRKIVLDSGTVAAWSQAGRLVSGNDQQRLLTVLALFVLVEWIQRRHPHALCLPAAWPRAARWSVYTLLIWFTLYLGTIGDNPFIYFQF
jgi:D-alanyl-lipoteichoic acid acyltransferase DltB (MBOAT superfamily)